MLCYEVDAVVRYQTRAAGSHDQPKDVWLVLTLGGLLLLALGYVLAGEADADQASEDPYAVESPRAVEDLVRLEQQRRVELLHGRAK